MKLEIGGRTFNKTNLFCPLCGMRTVWHHSMEDATGFSEFAEVCTFCNSDIDILGFNSRTDDLALKIMEAENNAKGIVYKSQL